MDPTTKSRYTRRELLTTLGAAPLLFPALAAAAAAAPQTAAKTTKTTNTAAAAGDVFLIAHRGGIVDDTHPENSPSSVESAIERRFWMLEVDIRRTKDGEAVVQHDGNFGRFYGVPRAVDQMTWSEIQALRATPGGSRPMTFDELCARCAGRVRLMLDIKGDDYPDAFYEHIIASLTKHRLLETTWSLSGGRVPVLTKGTVARAVNRRALAEAVAAGEPVAKTTYLFELGSVLDEPAVQLCRQHQVTPVAALNTFRYEQAKVDHWQGAEADARRLLAIGVRHFQIDSIYAKYLTVPQPA